MAQPEIEKLLGGYATGTLTDAERRRLFEVAMHDQGLFDALTDEQALKELLDDPHCRQRLLHALEAREREGAAHPLGALWQWCRRPATLATAGGLAAGFLAVWILVAVQQEAGVAPPEGDRVARLSETREDAGVKPPQEGVRESVAPATLEAKQEQVKDTRPKLSELRDRLASRASPPARDPAARPDRKMKAAPEPPAARGLTARETRPLWLTAHQQPMKAGPARRWFYARPEPAPAKKARPAPKATPRTRAEEAADAFAPMAGMEREGAGKEVRPLGLRYSVLREGEDGEFTETSPEGPFRTDDALRLTIEVNEPGYLYVFRLGPRGTWTRLSPADPVGQAPTEPVANIPGGRRYVLPTTGVLSLYGEPAVNKMVVIYSRTARQELQAFRPAGLEREMAEHEPSADLESLLSRARIEASTRPLIVEQIQPGIGKETQERAVYIVNPEAGRDAAIAIELTFPSR